MNLPDYNPIFIDHFNATGKPFSDATTYGLTVRLATGYPCWRLIGIHHLTGDENKGNHHAFCDTLDENGQRVAGTQLVMKQDNGSFYATVDKPANEAGTNFPLWSKAIGSLSVFSVLPSDEVQGIRSTFPDEGAGTTWGHHSFYIVFQRVAKGSDPPIEPPEPPTDPEPPKPPAEHTHPLGPDDLAMIEAARLFAVKLQVWAEGKLK